ncbi:MAG: TolC family protein [Dysgonamonadaceae bacterium]|jgi:outer membrane protein TolC|nr:TolC family protein [Dysgonamonadaceae bacterium]
MKKFALSIVLLAITTIPALSQEVFTLEKCKELALKNNAQTKNAEIAVESSKQQQKEAFTKYFPSISASANGFVANKPMVKMEMDMSAQMQPLTNVLTPLIGWAMMNGAPIDPAALTGLQNQEPAKIEAMKNGIIAGLTATQPIFAGGQIVTGNRLAKAGVEVRKLQKQLTENEVLLTTERYFWQFVSLQEKMKTIENSETMLAHILSDVKVAVDAGLTTRNDLLRVELEQNRLAANRSKAENGMQELKLALAQMIGIPAGSFNIEPPAVIAGLARNSPDDEAFPAFAEMTDNVENRPEYKLLDKNVEIAKMQTQMEIGKNLPTIAVGAGYNYMNFDLHTGNGMKNNFGMVFVTVSVPITDWWGGSHAVKRKKLEQQAAENTKKEKAELLLIRMQNIRNQVNEAYNQALIAKKSIAAAEENLKISRDNYNAGLVTISDLLEAQNLLQQQQDAYVSAIAEYYKKAAEWKSV